MPMSIVQPIKGLNRRKRLRKVGFTSPLHDRGRALISSPCLSWFSDPQTWTGIYTMGSLALCALNHTTSFPGSLAQRWQIMRLFSIQIHMNQYLIFIYIHINFFFYCFVYLKNLHKIEVHYFNFEFSPPNSALLLCHCYSCCYFM